MTTEPQPGDSDQKLLFRWCLKLSQANGELYAPRADDSKNNLLFKIAALYDL
jgi:hypothetical protein